MFATFVNAAAIIIGSLIGLALRKGLAKRYEETIFNAAGIITLVIGIQMAFKTSMILGLSLALIIGGLIGTFLNIEGGILGLGEILKRRFAKNESDSSFAYGFLNASVLFCSGAMAILGSFQAGTEGVYSILLTKSILDGFISIMFAGTMGAGVAFSALSVFVYQGLLTVGSVWAKPYVSPLMLSELTGIGGALVIMISLGLLGVKKFKTGDFLPALVLMAVAVLVKPFIPFL
ncbi:MAG: DUF554 domain-containing protein [Rectinemataceae bacterium]|nr:DUF554 domain-containing protein [Rectinemataceae bacterium]